MHMLTRLSKQFGGKAAELAKGPAAAFARLKNSIFLARAEIANGGLAASLARISQLAIKMIDRVTKSGQLAALGARIGAGLERLPGILGTIVERLMLLGRYAREWWRQMGVGAYEQLNHGGGIGEVRAIRLRDSGADREQPMSLGPYRGWASENVAVGMTETGVDAPRLLRLLHRAERMRALAEIASDYDPEDRVWVKEQRRRQERDGNNFRDAVMK